MKPRIYELHRGFWDWAFQHTRIVKPHICAIYSFAIDINNRKGWKDIFSLPTDTTMEATGIKSYNTYKQHLDTLVEHKLIEVIEWSRNQYTSNIIRLCVYQSDSKSLDHAILQTSDEEISVDHIKSIGSTVDPEVIDTLPAFGRIRHNYELRGQIWDDETARHTKSLVVRIKNYLAHRDGVHISEITNERVYQYYLNMCDHGGWIVENHFSIKTLDTKFAAITQNLSPAKGTPRKDRYEAVESVI